MTNNVPYYDRWRTLAIETWGKSEVYVPDSDIDRDAAVAIEMGIEHIEAYVNSGELFDDEGGIGFITEFDTGHAEQANWFFGIAFDSMADEAGVESDAWNEQGRNA